MENWKKKDISLESTEKKWNHEAISSKNVFQSQNSVAFADEKKKIFLTHKTWT